jgi:hypothetical protein
MTPETALLDTARFTAGRTAMVTLGDAPDPWIVTGAALIAQQAAAIALRAAGDTIPAQAGATELLLRAAHKDRLPPPYTLPFGTGARTGFDRLVEARNAFMHPRGTVWHVGVETLVRGLPAATHAVRHLILTQPVLPNLVSPKDQAALQDHLEAIEALAEFLGA